MTTNAIDMVFKDTQRLQSGTNPWIDKWAFLDGVISFEFKKENREICSTDTAMYFIDTTNGFLRVCRGQGYRENGYDKFRTLDYKFVYDPEANPAIGSMTPEKNLALLPTHDYFSLDLMSGITLAKFIKYNPYKQGQTR